MLVEKYLGPTNFLGEVFFGKFKKKVLVPKKIWLKNIWVGQILGGKFFRESLKK